MRGKSLATELEQQDTWLDHKHPVDEDGVVTPFPEGSTAIYDAIPVTAGRDPDLDTSALQVGSRIDRFEINEVLGEGAFGVVLLAFDPHLNRKLAIKLLKRDVSSSPRGRDAQQRLLREARALAKLSHPNVVAVHDIGTVDNQVYVAMEYVEGMNLCHWLSAKDCSRDEILGMFYKAGQGLLAAHNAGLVHRDFKPENVLVSLRGEVRVADFGLVGVTNQSEEVSTQIRAQPELSITEVGAIMGTAIYMSPEQHCGEELGPASDQFSFCVSLYWALKGEMPFPGSNYNELRFNVLTGNFREAKRTNGLPRWLDNLLRRGMQARAQDRFASMEELLRELSRHRRSRVRPYALAGLALLVIGGGAFSSAALMNGAEPPCAEVAEATSALWNRERAASLGQVFERLGRGNIYDYFKLGIDGYVFSIKAARERSCRETYVEKKRSAATYREQDECLGRRAGYLDALLTETAGAPSTQFIDKARSAIARLPSVEDCTRDELGFGSGLDPQSNEELVSVRRALEHARAYKALGEMQKARDTLHAVLEEDFESAMMKGRVLTTLARTEIELGEAEQGETLSREAIGFATRAGDDATVAEGWRNLMQLEGIHRQNFPRAFEYAENARLALQRGRQPELALLELEIDIARLSIMSGKFEDALKVLLATQPLFEAIDEPITEAHHRVTLGTAYMYTGTWDEAIIEFELALSLISEEMGGEHHEMVEPLSNLSLALKRAGRLDDAIRASRRALAVIENIYGKGHRLYVGVLLNLGELQRSKGELDQAEKTLLEAVNTSVEQLPEDPVVHQATLNLALLYQTRGQRKRAVTRYREALAHMEKNGQETMDTATALSNLSGVLGELDELDEAIEAAGKALAIEQRTYGEDSPELWRTLAVQGHLYIRMGRLTEAEQVLEKSLSFYERYRGPKDPQAAHPVRSLLAELFTGQAAYEKALNQYERMEDTAKVLPLGVALGKVQTLWELGDKKRANRELADLEKRLAVVSQAADAGEDAERTVVSDIQMDLPDAQQVAGDVERWKRSR